VHHAYEAGALEDLQVMSDGALRDVELARELLRRAGPVSQEADDTATQLVSERTELLGVGDDERVLGGVLDEVTSVDDGRPYEKSRPYVNRLTATVVSRAVSEVVVEATRGGVVEARHIVHAVAVTGGSIVASAGDPSRVAYMRSSAKPFQALPLVRARHDLDDTEVAIACASHFHRPDQLAPVLSLLAKASADEDDLECGPEPTPLEHNCSGKHAGMLLLCRERGWAIDDYRLPSHPCQQAMLAEVSAALEVDPSTIATSPDGCGVVTYAVPLERMAHAFSRLEQLDGGERAAEAMRARPELVGGPGNVDTELMLLGQGWVAKYGAEGLLCASRDGLGIAAKAEDGAKRALGPAISVLLAWLGLDAGELERAAVTNSRGEVVGELRAR
jgi:L-asparaginase